MSQAYARFYKCDLQMQTPAEPHWRDAATKLSTPASPEERKRVATAYLEACYAAGLEVIGITDHNFAPSAVASLINELRAMNRSVAASCGRDPVTILPGFEVEAHVGHGCHVLCLFPPETPLDVIESRVTAMGLPPDRRFAGNQPCQSECDLKDILRIVQDDNNYPGVVIAAHAKEAKGIFDSNRISEWLQQEEFRNEELLCLEIPKPPGEMSVGWQHLLDSTDQCQPDWKRRRPIACIMSSDCYRVSSDPSDPGGYIGYRFTWIKMSRPSIEALRQAFLDKQSRIRFGDSSPDATQHWPKIRSVTVEGGAFIRRRQRICWSPNFNCLIGSRGAGKSTFLDYMRVALDRMQKGDLPQSLADEVTGRVDTLLQGGSIEVEFETVGGVYKVVYAPSSGEKRLVYPAGSTEPDRTLDIRTLFPCRILSQREIDRSVTRESRDKLLKILDDFIHPELTALEEKEQDLRGAINQLDAVLLAARDRQKRRSSLMTQIADLERLLEAQQQLNKVLPAWTNVEKERHFFQDLAAACETILGKCKTLSASLDVPSVEAAEAMSTENRDLLVRSAKLASGAVTDLQTRITSAATIFEQLTVAATSPLKRIQFEEWLPRHGEVEAQFKAAQEVGNPDARSPEELAEIPGMIESLKGDLSALDKVLEQAAIVAEKRKQALGDLRVIWRRQTQARIVKAEQLMERLTDSGNKKPYVGIRIAHQGDREALISMLDEFVTDKRRLTRDDISTVLDNLNTNEAPDSPLLERFINAVRQEEDVSYLNGLSTRRREALSEVFASDTLSKLELRRVSDQVTYLVYRRDGTLAGPIDKVSAGQQGTAILNLLLAAGEEPLVVDTPEEGLDNEGVYGELVPLFRREKEKRQIIIVTHNANLPVNGDAEGIVALEATGFVDDEFLEDVISACARSIAQDKRAQLSDLVREPDWEKRLRKCLRVDHGWDEPDINTIVARIGDARMAEGQIKRLRIDGKPPVEAVGGLDKHEVKCSVQDIMEGSAEAFHRRREKYGF